MNSNHLYEYITLLARVLSVGYYLHYGSPVLEKEISYSSFFQKLEKDNDGSLYISEVNLIKEIYPDEKIDLMDVPTYNQCLWAAESYLRIQNECKLSFEAIFLYIPLKDMYGYFVYYHEMDFSQIINVFNELYDKHSTLELEIKKQKTSLKEMSEKTNIPYSTLFSLKKRKRNIKEVNGKTIYAISSFLKIRMETLLEIAI